MLDGHRDAWDVGTVASHAVVRKSSSRALQWQPSMVKELASNPACAKAWSG